MTAKGPPNDAVRRSIARRLRPGSAAARAILGLKSLPKWPRDRTFISKLREHDERLYNSAYNNFKAISREVGMSRVQSALWLAGIVVPAGMTRGTSLAADLDQFSELVRNQGKISEQSLSGSGLTLFRRLKKRAGKEVTKLVKEKVAASMKAIAYLLARADPSFDPTSVFEKLPPGLYVGLPKLAGPQWYWDSDARHQFVDLIKRMHTAGLKAHQFVPEPFAKLSDGAQAFLSRVNSDAHRAKAEWNWGDLVQEALEVPYAPDTRGRAGAARFKPECHDRCLPRSLAGSPGVHRRLRSGAETTVDGVLALLVGAGRYERIHGHDVPVKALVAAYRWKDDVDICLVTPSGRGVVEVRHGTPDTGYNVRLSRKQRALSQAGIPAVFLDGQLAGKSYERELHEKLTFILAAIGITARCSIKEALEHVGKAPHHLTRFPTYLEACSLVRREQITSMARYHLAFARLGLPSNPNLTYKGKGWSDWSAFLGVVARPGRKKGVVYPGDLKRRKAK